MRKLLPKKALIEGLCLGVALKEVKQRNSTIFQEDDHFLNDLHNLNQHKNQFLITIRGVRKENFEISQWIFLNSVVIFHFYTARETKSRKLNRKVIFLVFLFPQCVRRILVLRERGRVKSASRSVVEKETV